MTENRKCVPKMVFVGVTVFWPDEYGSKVGGRLKG